MSSEQRLPQLDRQLFCGPGNTSVVFSEFLPRLCVSLFVCELSSQGHRTNELGSVRTRTNKTVVRTLECANWRSVAWQGRARSGIWAWAVQSESGAVALVFVWIQADDCYRFPLKRQLSTASSGACRGFIFISQILAEYHRERTQSYLSSI